MQYRALGDTGFKISEFGFGTWELGGQEWGAICEDAAIGLLHYAFDEGINLYDTADAYGAGRSGARSCWAGPSRVRAKA